jgi:DNA polymerase IV
VVLRLRFADYSRATRSWTMSEATADTQVLLGAAHRLLRDAMPMIERRGVTLIGIALANLADRHWAQLVLPLWPGKGRGVVFAFGRDRALDDAIDRVRDRFGVSAITRGVLVGRDPGVTVPMLPD